MSTSPFNLSKITHASHWTRVVLTVVYLIVVRFAQTAMQLIALLQLLATTLMAKPHPTLTAWANSLSNFIYQCNRFVGHQTEERPFPFQPWPN